jgi:gamma-tubulin complex component 2
MQEEEASLLDNLLYVFMGYEGQYTRFAEAYSPVEEKIRLVGSEFRISLGLQDLMTSILKMAAHYCAMEASAETQSREEFGSVNHPLCAAI